MRSIAVVRLSKIAQIAGSGIALEQLLSAMAYSDEPNQTERYIPIKQVPVFVKEAGMSLVLHDHVLQSTYADLHQSSHAAVILSWAH